MEENRKDSKFKESCIIEGYTRIPAKGIIKSQYYHPDCVFEKGNKIVIVESSFTGDRKTHLGELLQFY